MLSIFSYGYLHIKRYLYVFFDEVSVQILFLFLNWVFIFLLLNSKSSLYILVESFLSDVSFTIYPPVCGLSSHSLDIISIDVLKLLF